MINRVYIIGKYLTVFPMFDPEELNSKINQSFNNQQKVEDEAVGLENKLLENYYNKHGDYMDASESWK